MEAIYPTDPVEIVLSDGKARGLRFTAAALRRVAKAHAKLAKDPESIPIDQMAAVLWEGLLDREGIKQVECSCECEPCTCGSLLGLIDARAIEHLNAQVAKAMPAPKNPPTPVSEA